MHEIEKRIIRKKKSRFFETYIYKIIKKISIENGITSNAKQQLNSVICLITKIICNVSRKFVKFSNKKTVNIKEINKSLQFILPNELYIHANKRANNSVKNNCNNNNILGKTRQKKANIIFPPSIIEKFLRNFGYSKIMISKNSTIYLASIIQYLVEEIIENAVNNAKNNKHIRITIRDIELGIREDKDLNNFFIKNNILFLGGGVNPYIHPKLLMKNKKKSKILHNNTDNNKRKKHRFKPGTVSLREIRKFQKISNCLTCCKLPFEKLIRNKFSKINNNFCLKINKEVFIILQYFIEQQIVNLLKCANLIALHCKRVKVLGKDINFIFYIKNNTNNNYNNLYDSSYIKKIDDLNYNLSNDHQDNEDVENEDVENEDVENEDVENEDVENEDVENEDVENEDVENEDVENEDVENEDVENEDVENEDVENEDVENEDVK